MTVGWADNVPGGGWDRLSLILHWGKIHLLGLWHKKGLKATVLGNASSLHIHFSLIYAV